MPEEKKPAGEEKIDPGSEAAMKILTEIKEKLEGKPVEKKEEIPAGPDPAEARAALLKRTGFTEDQLRAQEEMVAAAQAPLVEGRAWDSLERGHKDLSEYKKDVEKEMLLYRPEFRTPELAEKLFWMVKGRSMDKRGAEPKAKEQPKTRISSRPGYSGSDTGMAPVDGGDGEPTLSEDETEVVDRLGRAAAPLGAQVDAKTYEASKKSKKIGQFRSRSEIDLRSANPADRELQRLQGR